MSRFCIACRHHIDQYQRIRVIRDYEYGILLEYGLGRSAYLCCNHACIIEAYYKKRLQKALRCQIPDSVYVAIEQRVQHDCRRR